ncbi:uncharacterized protein EV420DRAFT_1646417 [Desarmillaria tabescens]|uniref:Uncharacterized protein n=1 Tax=Armillaria tabescens TaxID=1929756 RepID=A0AA39MXQ7_ARMTA|nr:uncharacterized protein EV420DRAFT_1646417 [Desarmillaria tabescens]KAK0450497.1 hypothetical protein EV420DRAFT_1646417 [Desarmillaria tabescens]
MFALPIIDITASHMRASIDVHELEITDMFVPLCPECGILPLNLPAICKGAYQLSHFGQYYVKCPGYISPEAREAGGVPTCNYFRWLTAERVLQIIYNNPEWEVEDYLRQKRKMQSTFSVSGASSSWTICRIEGCSTRGSKMCGFCKTHCHESGRQNVCGPHGYRPVGLTPKASRGSTASSSVTMQTTGTPVIGAPPDGIDNREEFARHLDVDWGRHLIKDAGYPVQSRMPAPASGLAVVTPADAVQPMVDRVKRRDQELAEKEHTIKVTIFVKNDQAAEHFKIAVLSKDWPMFSPKKYAIIARACGIAAGELKYFQRYEEGVWVNYDEKIRIRKDENVVLRLLGVQVCQGFETKKRPRSSSPTSGVQSKDQPSPTKTVRTMQGRIASTTYVLQTTGSSSSTTTISLVEDMTLIDLSISDDDDDDLYVPIAPVQESMELPAVTGRNLSNAEANTPGRGDGIAWPFKWAIDQHECFAQIEELLKTEKDMKVAQAFLKVVPQSSHWVEGTWHHHYTAWKAIKDNMHHPLRKALVKAIQAGRTEDGKWSPFALRK